MPTPSVSRGTVIALTLAAACWGFGTVVSKRAVAEIPALTLLPIQLGASMVLLAILMRARGLPLRDPTAPPILGRLGILNPGTSYALSLLGLASITASLSVLLWALEPLLILVLAAWLLRERITPTLVVLSLIAVGGMLLVISRPDSTGSPLGIALTVGGVACCAIYTVVTRRWLPSSDSTAQVVLAQQAYALGFAFVLVATLWILGGTVVPTAVSPVGWASAIGSGCLYYGMAYWLYLTGLRQAPASIASASFYLIPIFGVAGGFAFLEERFEPSQWVGVTIVLVSIALIYGRSMSTAEPVPAESRLPAA